MTLYWHTAVCRWVCQKTAVQEVQAGIKGKDSLSLGGSVLIALPYSAFTVIWMANIENLTLPEVCPWNIYGPLRNTEYHPRPIVDSIFHQLDQPKGGLIMGDHNISQIWDLKKYEAKAHNPSPWVWSRHKRRESYVRRSGKHAKVITSSYLSQTRKVQSSQLQQLIPRTQQGWWARKKGIYI